MTFAAESVTWKTNNTINIETNGTGNVTGITTNTFIYLGR